MVFSMFLEPKKIMKWVVHVEKYLETAQNIRKNQKEWKKKNFLSTRDYRILPGITGLYRWLPAFTGVYPDLPERYRGVSKPGNFLQKYRQLFDGFLDSFLPIILLRW